MKSLSKKCLMSQLERKRRNKTKMGMISNHEWRTLLKMLMLTKEQSDFIEQCMMDLYFAQWDRFIDYIDNNIRRLRIYGWIQRKDNCKDFVMLEIFPGDLTVSYLTSSAMFTDEIGRILYGEAHPHEVCHRVESMFKINNSIKL